MAIVDSCYYYNVYAGKEADPLDFESLEVRAEDVIGAMTRWQVTEDTIASLSPIQRSLAKKAICAQVDFFAINGLDSVSAGDGANGFTVGKVSVGGRNVSGAGRSGSMAGHVSPLAIMYLEQSGLMNPAVPVSGGFVC